MLSKTVSAAAAATLLAALCATPAAQAVTKNRVQIQTGSNMCTLSVPTIDTEVRPRATGYTNEGTSNAFVICSFDAPPGAYFIDSTSFSWVILYVTTTDGGTRDVKCTGVNSMLGSGAAAPQFVAKTVTVTSTAGTFQWVPADFGGTTTIPYSSGAFSVTCILPPNTAIRGGRADSQEDVGA